MKNNRENRVMDAHRQKRLAALFERHHPAKKQATDSERVKSVPDATANVDETGQPLPPDPAGTLGEDWL